ncbi:MAG: peptidoglycan-binding protein [Oscillospiraceae bacterium]|jgi:peptidoglycan hydrolase-like protein with peptidoglycan-binding domain|nr:peptidoglycan-binding protein [Oscillospiraceae bacterium]
MKKRLIAFSLVLMLILTCFSPIAANAATLTWPVLRLNSTGANVTALQYMLNYYGYPVTVNGTFNQSTVNYVKSFQQAEGLSNDGVVGTNTWTALTDVLQRSSSYNANLTRAIQYLLNNKFGYSLTVNGVFNSATDAAVRSFQTSMGLTSDGIVGPNTWNNLIAASSAFNATQFWEDRADDGWVSPVGYTPGAITNGAKFNSSRDSGSRVHAGTDFYVSNNYRSYYLNHNNSLTALDTYAKTFKVRAMYDGVVVQISTNFYRGTKALAIEHADGTVARYGEIGILSGITVGTIVETGEEIGWIAYHNDVNTSNCDGVHMLHLEVYLGNSPEAIASGNPRFAASTALTNTTSHSYYYANVPSSLSPAHYERRADLIDSTGARNLPLN